MNREILIVENDAAFRKSLKVLLAGDGYVFFEAPSVEEGLALISEHPHVRVIILDLSFPGTGGVELLDRIKLQRGKYKVIVLTGHEELLVAERAGNLEVFCYLAKGALRSAQAIRFAVQQAFDAIEKEVLANILQKHLKIQESINGGRNLADVLNLICESVVDVVGGYTGHIRLYDVERGDFHIAAFSGRAEGAGDLLAGRMKIGEPYSGLAAKTKQPLLINDFQKELEFRDQKEFLLNSRSLNEDARDHLSHVRSAYVVPISTGIFDTSGAEVDAVLTVTSDSEAYFGPRLRAIVDEFAAQATLAIAKTWQQVKRNDLNNKYSYVSFMLAQVGENFGGHGDLNRVYDVVLRGLAEIIDAEAVSVFLFNENQGRLEKAVEFDGESLTKDRVESYYPGEGVTGCVFTQRVSVRLNNMSGHDAHSFGVGEELTGEAGALRRVTPSGLAHHYLGAPMMVGGSPLGVIRAVNKKSYYYGRDDIRDKSDFLLSRGFSDDAKHILGITASHLAAAIHNLQLIRKLNEELERLGTLTQVARVITSSSGMESDDLLRLIVSKTAEVMNAEICLLYLREAGKVERVVLKQAYGIPEDRLEGAFYELGEGETGAVALTGESLLKSRAGDYQGKYDGLTLDALQELLGDEARIKSIMVAPVVAEGTSPLGGRKILGVLKVINRIGYDAPFNEDDLRMFETFASQIGVALAMAERNFALSRLVGGVGHEISNTITIIPPNINWIRRELERAEGTFDRQAIEEALQTVEQVSIGAADFANDLLGFSAPRFRKKVELDINALIREQLSRLPDEVKRIKNAETVSVVLELSSEPVICLVHEVPFRHMFRNVVVNAYQAMEDMGVGTLTVRTYLDDAREVANIEVSDTGVGISADALPVIFDSTYSNKRGGNGLGLWLVRNYLAQVNGTISAESRVGEGATFRIQLLAVNRQREY